MGEADVVVPPLTWRVAGGSVAGTSHIKDGRGGDDAFAFWVSPDGSCVVAAVADGAGSQTGTSALGSFAACGAVMGAASALASAVLDPVAIVEQVRATFAAARSAVQARASELGLPDGALATTMAVAVLRADGAVVAQVGDGAVVCDIDGHARALVKPTKGEYANETDFLTRAGGLDDVLLVEHVPGGVRRFALSTDGLRYKILRIQEGYEPFEPFFTATWDHVATGVLTSTGVEELLPTLADDQAEDDLTLVVGALGYAVEPVGAGWPSPVVFSAEPWVVGVDGLDESGMPVERPRVAVSGQWEEGQAAWAALVGHTEAPADEEPEDIRVVPETRGWEELL